MWEGILEESRDALVHIVNKNGYLTDSITEECTVT